MLRKLLSPYFHKPDQCFQSVKQINVKLLRSLGIRLVLIDLDNTLAHRKSPELSTEGRAFIRRAKAAGMRVVIVSNIFCGSSRRNRVESIARKHGIEAVCACFPTMKPHPRPFQEAIGPSGLPISQIVMIGDQCRTDGGAKALGIPFYKVPPLDSDGLFTRPSRWLENYVLAGHR